MPATRVFVSSTCYDLNVTRGQIRTIVNRIGHIPVMSDFLEVLYDPDEHTHESCIREVSGCDVVVLLIGGRFGGKGVPKAIEAAAANDVEGLTDEQRRCLSITQLEICRAISDGIPVYTFVQQQVWHDHRVYEMNKDSPQINKMKFPSIEKPATAKYIFEFINFLRQRSAGNSILAYTRLEEVEDALRQQWSALFQRMLKERRKTITKQRHDDAVLAEVSDLRAAVMSALSVSGLREVAQGTRRYRLMIYFLTIAGVGREELFGQKSFPLLLHDAGVTSIEDLGTDGAAVRMRELGSVAFIYDDSYAIAMGFAYQTERIDRYAEQWEDWCSLTREAKEAIVDTLLEDAIFLRAERVIGDYTQYRKRLAREVPELARSVTTVEVDEEQLHFGQKTYEVGGRRVRVREHERSSKHSAASKIDARSSASQDKKTKTERTNRRASGKNEKSK